ncbi:MAG: efflux RND transporter periplasmic adaptor subunit [Synechococcaceae cyanobacterium]|nr:efflux RND transporter periplasmic adaptor subunit [Synechococcaceae cyanobacterium]
MSVALPRWIVSLPRPGRRWRIGAALLGAALLVGTFAQQQARQRGRRLADAARTVPVVRRDVAIRVSAAGTIQPLTPINISPKESGRLAALLVDQGDRVQAGQILARMDATNLRGEQLRARGVLEAALARLRRLEAGNRREEIAEAHENLKEAQARLLEDESRYASNRQLYGSGAISRVEFDASRSAVLASRAHARALASRLELLQAGARSEDIAAARAEVTQARGALATIDTRVEDTVIRAPFSGVVTQKYADEGAFVTPTTSASATTSATSSSILALASTMEAVANVAEVDVGSVHPGQAVELEVDAFPGRRFSGRVRLVSPEAVVTQNVTSFQVRITLTDPKREELRSGMNLTAHFLVGRRPAALLIPTPAIVSGEGGTGVHVLQPDGASAFRRVRVGATVGSSTEVLSGLSEGERVFTSLPGQRAPSGRPVTGRSPFLPSFHRSGGPPPR